MALAASFSLTATGTLTNPLDLGTPTYDIAAGSGDFPACSFDVADGNGAAQAQSWWDDKRTLAAAATDSIDLYGSLTGPFGASVAAVKVKTILVAIDTPGSTKYLRIGPQNVANAAQLGFGGVGATVYYQFSRFALLEDVDAGWTITAGTGDILPIKNPSAVSIDYAIWITFTTS